MMKLILATIIILLEIMAIPGYTDESPPRFNIAKAEFPTENTVEYQRGRDIDINTFKIAPCKLTAGQDARLTWKVSGAARVFIDNDSDLDRAEVSHTGHMKITPLKSTSYILTAYDRHILGAAAVAVVDVRGQPPAPTISLKAYPDNIFAGEKVTLTWETRYADTIAIDHGIGTVGSRGTVEVEPQITTTYTLAAAGFGGGRIANITVTVINSQALRTVSGVTPFSEPALLPAHRVYPQPND